jgi:hypothetical protein
MPLPPTRRIFSQASAVSRLARRSYRSHEIKAFYPPSSGVASLIEPEPQPGHQVKKQMFSAASSMATTGTSKVSTALIWKLL